MTLVKIPLPIRIVAYLLGLLTTGIGVPLLVALTENGAPPGIDATVADVLGALVLVLAATHAPPHLTLPDTSTGAPETSSPASATPAPIPVTPTAASVTPATVTGLAPIPTVTATVDGVTTTYAPPAAQ